MAWLPALRMVTFGSILQPVCRFPLLKNIAAGTVSLFAAIVLSLSVDLIVLTEAVETGFYYKFSAFALATSAITLFTVVPMSLIDILRKGATFSYIVVEIVWLSVLWVLWLSSGSYAAWTDNQIEAFFPAESSCSYGTFDDNDVLNQGCSEIKSITAFSFLTWVILMAYTSILLVLGIRAQGRDNSVWTASVRDQAMFCPDTKSGGTPAQMHTMLTSVPQTYPPAPPPVSVPVPTPGVVQV